MRTLGLKILVLVLICFLLSCGRDPLQELGGSSPKGGSFKSGDSCQKDIANYIAKYIKKEEPSDVDPDTMQFTIYIDGSVSMRGFTKQDYLSLFTTLVRDMEAHLTREWAKSNLIFEYYTFSRDIRRLSKKEFTKIFQPAFFNGSHTNIDKVLDSTMSIRDNQLIVVITDLFQNEADVALLINKLQHLKKSHPDKSLSMGILGVKAPFDGMVYDVGPMSHKFYYKNSDDPNSFRPFYFLLLGTYSTLKRFYQNASAEWLHKVPKETVNFVIFSKNTIHTPLEYTKIVAINKKLTELRVLEPELYKYSRKFMLRSKDKDSLGSFSAIFKVSPFEFVLQPNLREAVLTVAVKKCSEKGSVMDNEPNAAKGIRIESGEPAGKHLNLTVHIDPHYFKESFPYFFELNFTDIKTIYPKWFEDWDIDLRQIPEWLTNPKSFDGSKTQCLRSFLTGSERVFAPSSGRTYFILTKK